jgi:hypothetical protein
LDRISSRHSKLSQGGLKGRVIGERDIDRFKFAQPIFEDDAWWNNLAAWRDFLREYPDAIGNSVSHIVAIEAQGRLAAASECESDGKHGQRKSAPTRIAVFHWIGWTTNHSENPDRLIQALTFAIFNLRELRSLQWIFLAQPLNSYFSGNVQC